MSDLAESPLIPAQTPLPDALNEQAITPIPDVSAKRCTNPRLSEQGVKFTPENAREMAKRSWDARRAALAAQIAALTPKTSPEPAKAQCDPFLKQQTLALRARMKEIDKLLSLEAASDDPDAAKMDRLASAWSKLAEQERISDGRPLPGSRKPANEPSTKRKPFNMQVE